MAVKLDSFTEAGARGLQGGSAGKPAHLAARVEVPHRGPVREWPLLTCFSGVKGLEWSEIPQQSLLRLDLNKNLCC
jgi:hypothetical protein